MLCFSLGATQQEKKSPFLFRNNTNPFIDPIDPSGELFRCTDVCVAMHLSPA